MIILINDCYKQAVIWSVLNSAWEMIQQWLTGVFILLKRFRSLKSDGWSEFIKRSDLKLQTTIILLRPSLRTPSPHFTPRVTWWHHHERTNCSGGTNRPQISAELFWFLFQISLNRITSTTMFHPLEVHFYRVHLVLIWSVYSW